MYDRVNELNAILSERRVGQQGDRRLAMPIEGRGALEQWHDAVDPREVHERVDRLVVETGGDSAEGHADSDFLPEALLPPALVTGERPLRPADRGAGPPREPRPQARR